MRGILVDTSVWIDFFGGETIVSLEEGLAAHCVILSPVVIAELVSGAIDARSQKAISDLVRHIPIHQTPRKHWVAVGEMRRNLRAEGFSISTPDAHIAQCALDRGALLLTRDKIFQKISECVALRLAEG